MNHLYLPHKTGLAYLFIYFGDNIFCANQNICRFAFFSYIFCGGLVLNCHQTIGKCYHHDVAMVMSGTNIMVGLYWLIRVRGHYWKSCNTISIYSYLNHLKGHPPRLKPFGQSTQNQK